MANYKSRPFPSLFRQLNFGLLSSSILILWAGLGVTLSAKSQQNVVHGKPARTQTHQRTSDLATPLTAQEVFRRVSPSIFIVEALDGNGRVVAMGSAVAVNLGTPGSEEQGNGTSPRRRTGSGDPIFSDYVITNNHVVKDSVLVRLRRNDTRWYPVIAATDTDHDLCLLRVDGLNAPAPLLRASSGLAIGERAYAIGAPEGLELTISEGIISGLRNENGVRIVQTTAAVSHGSSGGGLFDPSARLIGITTFTFAEGQTLNFALPAEWISALQDNRTGAWTLEQFEAYLAAEHGQSNYSSEKGNSSTEPSTAAENEYRTGKALVDQEQYEAALPHLREAVRLQADTNDVWAEIGFAYEGMHRYEDAIGAFKRVVQLCAKKVDDTERRQDPTWMALNAKSSLAMAWNFLGDSYRAAGRLAEATAAHQEAVGIDPFSALWLCELGVDYAKAEHWEDVIRVTKEALRLSSDICSNATSFCCSNLGLAYEKLGRHQEATDIRNRSRQQH